jgi:hypothetical protein
MSELLEVCWTKRSLCFRGVQKWPSLDLTLCRLKIFQYFIKSSTNEVMFDYCFFYSDGILCNNDDLRIDAYNFTRQQQAKCKSAG